MLFKLAQLVKFELAFNSGKLKRMSIVLTALGLIDERVGTPIL